MSKQQIIVADIEADGFIFESTKVWTFCAVNKTTGERIKVNPFKDPDAKQKILDFVFSTEKPILAGHFWLGYDSFVLNNLVGLDFSVGPDTLCGKPVQYVDSYYLSMFLNPDRAGHSIEYFGQQLGLPKIDWREKAVELGLIEKNSPKGQEFMQWHPEMDVYCDRDIDVNSKVLDCLFKEWEEVYRKPFEITDAFRCGQKSFYLMSCQELTGWKFDLPYALEVKEKIGIMMEEIRAEVEPKLPPRKLKKGEQKEYTMPAKPFLKSGEFSSSWLKFVEKHNGILDENTGLWNFYGKQYPIIAGSILDIELPMEMANQDQMKDWFVEQGWKSTLWNYQRGPDGKPMRDPKTRKLIPTTPKMQEAGKICPNLLAMEGDIVKQVVKWLSLRNRQSVLEGWITNERLRMDGRLGAGRTGIAATHRQRHKTVCNVPKASEKVLLGKEFRSLFIADDGMLIAAGDAAALEGRVQGHYCVPMDARALTRTGWKTYYDLEEGEDILAYNPMTKMKEWTPLLEKCSFPDVETFEIKNNKFKVRATANHRWFVSKRDTTTGLHRDLVLETKDLTTACNILVNAPMTEFAGDVRGIFDGKYGVDWVSRLMSKGLPCMESFLEGFLVADGCYNNQNASNRQNPKEIGKGRWKFAQNLGEHFEAALTCAYVTHHGYLNVAYRETPSSRMGIVTLNKRNFVGMQRMEISPYGKEEVWCPRTKFGSWIMRQGDVITITGNTYKYDGGLTAYEMLQGDIHSKNAFAFYGHDPLLQGKSVDDPDFNKEDPIFKPFRDRSKNGFYSILYGAGGPKVASTLGLPERMGNEKMELFWEANPGTKQLKDNLEKYWETTGRSKYLPAIDGRMLCTRKKSALLNTIFQSCGGIAMDYACCFMDSWLGGIKWKDRKPYYLYKGYTVRRIGYSHDELEFECDEPIAEEVSKMIEKAIAKAGEYLKMKIELAGEGKVGASWCEVH